MERVLAILSFYDPDHLVDPGPMKVSTSEARREVAGEGSLMDLWHSPEGFIERMEEGRRQ